MSEYRMKEILDEAHQQRERAERAEAECERLRVALQNVWGALQPCPEQGEIAMARSMVSNALATPPPEGEPNLDEYPSDLASMTRREYLESQGKTIDAPHTPERDFTVGEDGYFNFHTPEQAHGGALADAISICEGVPAQDAYIAGKKRAVWGRWVDADALLPLLRQALTASGVPELKKERLWGICMAYEKGVCVGADGTDLPDPYPEGSNDSHAYQYGLQVGRENRENRIAAAPTDGRGP